MRLTLKHDWRRVDAIAVPYWICTQCKRFTCYFSKRKNEECMKRKFTLTPKLVKKGKS